MFKRILIVVDDKPSSQAAVQEGTALAAAHGAEAVYLALLPTYPVALADAPSYSTVAPQEFHDAALAKADELLAHAVTEAEHAGVSARRSSQEGANAQSIVEAASRRRCDLIVVAADEHNAVMRLLTGSPVPGLITSAPMPVLVCKHHESRGALHA